MGLLATHARAAGTVSLCLLLLSSLAPGVALAAAAPPPPRIAAPLAALGTLDQSYEPTTDLINAADAVQFGSAQVFTAGLTGVLDTVALDGAAGLFPCSGITQTVQIRSVTAQGAPAGLPEDSSAVLAEQTVVCAAGFYNITFTNPTTVVQGHQYAIVFGLDGSAIYHEFVEGGGTYVGGTFCGSDDGGPYVCIPGYDWLFRTYVTPAPVPDARIKRAGGSVRGNNIYNLDGTDQTTHTFDPAGGHRRLYVSIQNDGTVAGSFTVKASGTANEGFLIRYFRGTDNADVTAAVEAGTFTTPVLAPGAAYRIRVRIDVCAPSDFTLSRLVTATSVANPNSADAVSFIETRKDDFPVVGPCAT